MCIMAVMALCLGFVNADDVLPPPSLSDQPHLGRMDDLIRQLDHRRYQMRNEAEAELLSYGIDAIAALTQASERLGTEGSLRGVRILERSLVSSDLVLADAADEALQDLQEIGGLIGEHATLALDRHGRLREERAIARIQELGGDVRPAVDFFMEDLATRILPEDLARAPMVRSQTIWLYPEWTGGTEGLELLKRFSHQLGMTIYQIRGNELSLSDVQPLLAHLPGAEVMERGPACLGIQCDAFEPCIIRKTTPGGAAEQGNLLPGDEIQALNNETVDSFNQLIDELSLYDPGDEVTLTVRRGYGKPEDLTITLSHWRDINEHALIDDGGGP
jgi:hypothetical protein